LLGSLWFGSFSASGGGGGSADYELISTTVLGSNTGTITFSSGGTWSAYKHLQIRMVARSSSSGNVQLRVNSDTGTNYSWHRLTGNGSSASSYGLDTRSYIQLPEATTEATIFSATILDILDFGSTTKNKTMRSFSGYVQASNQMVNYYSAAWQSTSAITDLTISDFTSGSSFTTGSRFSLYGLKG
jgi:hypothetical protein